MSENQTVIEWPTTEGIWMGLIGGDIGWFPLRTIFLRDDLPTRAEMDREAAGEIMPASSLDATGGFPMNEVFEALLLALCAVGAVVVAAGVAYWIWATGTELRRTWRDWRNSR